MKQLFSIVTMLLMLNLVNAQSSEITTEKKDIKQLKKETKTDRIKLHELQGDEVGFQSKQNFAVDFDGVTNAIWVREKYFDVASFSLNGKDTKAYYDNQGLLVGSVNTASFDDLQQSSQKDIKKHYKNYTIQKVVFYKDNTSNETDMVLYDNQFDDADSYFVELSSGTKKVVLQVYADGNVSLFKTLS